MSRGAENAYTCPKCGGLTVTIDRDTGVTPMFLNCRATSGCKGMAVSQMYPKGPRPAHIPPPAWEWYRPSEKKAKREDRKYPGMYDHYKQGGLFIRAIVRPSPEKGDTE